MQGMGRSHCEKYLSDVIYHMKQILMHKAALVDISNMLDKVLAIVPHELRIFGSLTRPPLNACNLEYWFNHSLVHNFPVARYWTERDAQTENG